MRETITISMPEEIKKQLDKITSQEGTTRSNIIRESLRDYLFANLGPYAEEWRPSPLVSIPTRTSLTVYHENTG